MTREPIRAPELPDHLEWYNTGVPIRLREQRGKMVLLDFWTYCCINCLHILPDLRYLEEKYRDGLVVIGIHSPKFPHERVAENVQKAINRHHIRHPVANDPTLQVWRQYAIRAWPSIICIDPEGYVLGVVRGEGRRKQLDGLIAEQLEKAERSGRLNTEPLALRPRPEASTTLAFPGKLLATGSRVYVSDSGHNRVVEATAGGAIVRVFGGNSPGFVDGQGDAAAFSNPQGLSKIDEFLYVADTGNHAVRRINLRDGDVQTVAGNGRHGRGGALFYTDPLQAALNSPWDLAYHGGNLYIGMAGQHQIWSLQLSNNTIGRLAGSGREGIDDGAPDLASFAQPSALTVGDFRLYVADAESSALRSLRLPDARVETLVGLGLFEFGDVDANGQRARLQHPMGLAFDGGRACLWIADTYNNKIKRYDMKTNVVSSSLSCPELAEPGGLSLHRNQLWIANTNAHDVRCMDLDSGDCRRVDMSE